MLLKNTWLFAKQHTALFVLLILTQLAAIEGILLSYGIALNNQYNLEAAERDFHSFMIWYENPEEQEGIAELVKRAFPEVLSGYEDILERGFVSAYAQCELENYVDPLLGEGWIKVSCFIGYDGERYTSDDAGSKFNMQCTGGNWFTDEAINEGAKQCIVRKGVYELEKVGVRLSGEYYQIVAYEQEIEPGMIANVIIPLESLSDAMKIEYMDILFIRPLTHIEYSELYSRMVEVFGPLPEYEDNCSLDIDEKATMHTMIINSILIALLAAFTVCLLYRYLLEKRKVMTAVYEICGCTGWRAAGVYIGEMLLLFACTAVGGMLVFWYVIKPYMEKSFPWFSAIYKGETAFRLVGVYAVVVLVVVTVMICGVTKKQPKEILREG